MKTLHAIPLSAALTFATAASAPAQTYDLDTLAPAAITADDQVGSAVDVSGTTLIVGGDGHDAGGVLGTGGAWIFERVAGGGFAETADLKPADGVLNARFGHAVAIDGDVAMVGAHRDSTVLSNAGSVYVYTRQPDGSWLETQKLTASDPKGGGEFGHAVAIDGDYAVVGSPGALPLGLATAGGYVFERQPDDSWLEVAKLASDDSLGNDDLGSDVSISGTRVVMGAYKQDDNGNSSGAAYVYERQNDGTWPWTGKLLASDGAATDYFGYSVSVSGDAIVVGAWLDDDFGSGTGAAYVYELQPDDTWLETAKLLPGIEKSNGHFGQSVWIDGDYAVIGAIHSTVEFKFDAGAAYGFERAGGAWPLVQTYLYDDVDSDQNFGNCVAADDGTVVIGSSDNDEFATNGGLATVHFSYEGSSEQPPVVQGVGTDGCDGPQTMGVNLPPMIDTADFGLTCDNAPAASTGFLLLGTVADVAGSDPLGIDVTLHVDLFLSVPFVLADFPVDANGDATASVPLPNSPSLVGAVVQAQGVFAWSTCTLGAFNLSSSKLLTFTISAP